MPVKLRHDFRRPVIRERGQLVLEIYSGHAKSEICLLRVIGRQFTADSLRVRFLVLTGLSPMKAVSDALRPETDVKGPLNRKAPGLSRDHNQLLAIKRQPQS